MSNANRQPFLTATVLDQSFLNACADNLANQLELAVDIEKPGGGYLRVSDRNKYIGSVFYEARTKFPEIRRTLGEFLSPTLEFSSLDFEISNVDGKYNDLLPAGANFSMWVGKTVEVKLGLRDVASTYRTIFRGRITEQAGFRRTVKGIQVTSRDDFDKLNDAFPKNTFKVTDYPDIEDDKANALKPVVYGDWTVNTESIMPSVPAIPVNGADQNVNGEISHLGNVELVISDNANTYLDAGNVHLRRGQKVWKIAAADVVSVNANKNYFEVVQNSLTMTPVTEDTDIILFEYGRGDEFFVYVKGKDLGTYDDNPVSIARDILTTYGGLVSGDFHANWDTYRDKATPAVSAVANIKARAHINEEKGIMEYALSLLEQVRLEAFIDKDRKLKIRSLHLEDFEAAPAFKLSNWDIEKNSFQVGLDERLNINRARGVFNLLPNRNENYGKTKVFVNNAAIAAAGKAISKQFVFPNLYVEADVENQTTELMRLTSAFIETVTTVATWRGLLLDVGDFVQAAVDIQGVKLADVPCMIRDLGYDANGVKLRLKLWSLQMVPFPGWAPGYAGITGGSSATIVAE